MSGALQASWVTEGATAYDTVNRARHWQAFLAVSILTAALLSIRYVRDVKSPRLALAVATLIYFSVGASGGFLLAEYAPILIRLIRGIWNIIIAVFEFMGSL